MENRGPGEDRLEQIKTAVELVKIAAVLGEEACVQRSPIHVRQEPMLRTGERWRQQFGRFHIKENVAVEEKRRRLQWKGRIGDETFPHRLLLRVIEKKIRRLRHQRLRQFPRAQAGPRKS